MDNEQLRRVMRYYLDHFNSSGKTITDGTKHQSILSNTGTPNTKDLYEGSVRYSLTASGNGEPQWPAEWMPMTVAELATALVPAIAALAKGTRPRRQRRRSARGLGRAAAAPQWLKRILGHKGDSSARKRTKVKARKSAKRSTRRRGVSRQVRGRTQ